MSEGPLPSLSVQSVKKLKVLVTQSCLTLKQHGLCPPSTEFPRQEFWSGSLFPYPGDLPNTGIKSGSPAFQTDYLSSELPHCKTLSMSPIKLVYRLCSLILTNV